MGPEREVQVGEQGGERHDVVLVVRHRMHTSGSSSGRRGLDVPAEEGTGGRAGSSRPRKSSVYVQLTGRIEDAALVLLHEQARSVDMGQPADECPVVESSLDGVVDCGRSGHLAHAVVVVEADQSARPGHAGAPGYGHRALRPGAGGTHGDDR